MKLRSYQQEAVLALSKAAISMKKGFLALPTGAGKTFTAAAWLNSHKDHFERAIWACHREELKKQAIDTLKLFFKESELSIWDAHNKPLIFNKVTIVMIPSTKKFPYQYFKSFKTFAVIDEAHHIDATTWNHFNKELSADFSVYLSATPKEEHRNNIIYEKDFKELVTEGYLAKPKYITVKTNCVYNLSVRGGEFTSSSLNQLDDPIRNDLIYKFIII